MPNLHEQLQAWKEANVERDRLDPIDAVDAIIHDLRERTVMRGKWDILGRGEQDLIRERWAKLISETLGFDRRAKIDEALSDG